MNGPNFNGEKGFALFGALIVTLLLIGLASGLALTEREHTLRASGSLSRARTLARAESVTDSVAAELSVEIAESLGIGGSVRVETLGAGSATIFVTRLDSTTYWIATRAFEGAGGAAVAERRVGRAIWLRRDSLAANGVSRIMQGRPAELF